MKKNFLRPFIVLAFMLCTTIGSYAQESFIGEIKLVGFNFAPRGWAECNGQLISISSNQALFSLLGTIYGGDGRTTFALPDLRGRIPVGTGKGPGLNDIKQGQKSGTINIPSATNSEPSPDNMLTPTLGLKYIICVAGMFPGRN